MGMHTRKGGPVRMPRFSNKMLTIQQPGGGQVDRVTGQPVIPGVSGNIPPPPTTITDPMGVPRQRDSGQFRIPGLDYGPTPDANVGGRDRVTGAPIIPGVSGGIPRPSMNVGGQDRASGQSFYPTPGPVTTPDGYSRDRVTGAQIGTSFGGAPGGMSWEDYRASLAAGLQQPMASQTKAGVEKQGQRIPGVGWQRPPPGDAPNVPGYQLPPSNPGATPPSGNLPDYEYAAPNASGVRLASQKEGTFDPRNPLGLPVANGRIQAIPFIPSLGQWGEYTTPRGDGFTGTRDGVNYFRGHVYGPAQWAGDQNFKNFVNQYGNMPGFNAK